METILLYHYVYRITNTKLNKHYYGFRSSYIEPILDLGHAYFSSSSDLDFIEDQKINPQDYKYVIVRTFEIREDASKFEIYLHNRFDVKNHSSFYNKANATSTGFDTAGVKHSNNTKQKMSNTHKKLWEDVDFRKKIVNAIHKKMEEPGHREKIISIVKKTWINRKHTTETIKKCSMSKLGKNNPNYGKKIPDNVKKKLSESISGIKRSEETKNKMSKAALNRVYNETKCPYCNRIGKNNMLRYHFDNCKWKN